MDSEDFKDYREDQKQRRRERLPRRTALILDLENHGFEVSAFDEYHFRVSKPGESLKIDIYPIHLRYHNIETGRRGQIRGEKKLLPFIQSQFEKRK